MSNHADADCKIDTFVLEIYKMSKTYDAVHKIDTWHLKKRFIL